MLSNDIGLLKDTEQRAEETMANFPSCYQGLCGRKFQGIGGRGQAIKRVSFCDLEPSYI